MKKYNYEMAVKLKKEYDDGATQLELDQKYNLRSYYLFKKFNMKCRTSGESKQIFRRASIHLAWDFAKVESEIQAYILGFLMADGSNNGNQIIFAQTLKNEALITKIKDYFSKQIKLSYTKTSCEFKISSKQACNNLMKWGIVPNKTHSELLIPNISSELLRHWIRGYFDGDGTIFVCTKKGIPKYLKGNICSPTPNILQEIQQVLAQYEIDSTINREKRIGKVLILPQGTAIGTHDMYRLFFRKKASLQKLYHFLYDDATIYLDYKKKVFDDYKHFYDNSEINSNITKGFESSYSVANE